MNHTLRLIVFIIPPKHVQNRVVQEKDRIENAKR